MIALLLIILLLILLVVLLGTAGFLWTSDQNLEVKRVKEATAIIEPFNDTPAIGGNDIKPVDPIKTPVTRTFTNRQGIEVVAELISVSETHAILRSNGKDYRTLLTNLSDNDQVYIREWSRNN